MMIVIVVAALVSALVIQNQGGPTRSRTGRTSQIDDILSIILIGVYSS